MALRTPHGRAATYSSAARFEALPFDELPAGLPDLRAPLNSAKADRLRERIAATEAELATATRGDGARVAKGTTATLLGRLGGYQRALRHELARLEAGRSEAVATLAAELLPGMVVHDPDFKAGLPLALDFLLVERQGLGRDVGAGASWSW